MCPSQITTGRAVVAAGTSRSTLVVRGTARASVLNCLIEALLDRSTVSPAQRIGIVPTVITGHHGHPDPHHISTSFVERLN